MYRGTNVQSPPHTHAHTFALSHAQPQPRTPIQTKIMFFFLSPVNLVGRFNFVFVAAHLFVRYLCAFKCY